jgi:colicin import membrane protein
MALIFAETTAKAQTSVSGKTAYNGREYVSYDGIRNENGKQVETIQTNLDDKLYKIKLVNDKMTELFVNGIKIAAADWDKYSDAIAAIREQIRKNKIQALRNQEQAVRNQEQAKKNQDRNRLSGTRSRRCVTRNRQRKTSCKQKKTEYKPKRMSA